MEKFVLLLRAVNVGGRNIIKMQQLKTVFAKAGFLDVKTYIQSGNIVFESKEANISRVKEQVSNLLKEHFNYELPIILIPFSYYKNILDLLPQTYLTIETPRKIYISFLTESPKKDQIETLYTYNNDNENFEVKEAIVFIWCVKDGTKLNFSNAFIERILKVSATTRNLNTVKKLTTY